MLDDSFIMSGKNEQQFDQNAFVIRIVSQPFTQPVSIIRHHTCHLLFCSRAFSLLNLILGWDVRWPTSALRIPNDTPNPKPHSEFLNLTPNCKNSLRILKTHSKFLKLTPNSKNSLRILKTHSKFLKLTRNSKNSLRILKTHSKFLKLTPNSKNSLRILKPHSEF